MSHPSPADSQRSVDLDGRIVPYILRPSTRARGLRAVIDPRRGLLVTVPASPGRGAARPEDRVEAFLREREAWVLRHLGRLERERAAARARGGARDGGLVHYRGVQHRVRVLPDASTGRRSVVERAGTDEGDELLVRLARGERRGVPRLLTDWFRERAAEAVERAVVAHAQALGVSPARVDLRDPRSRWGSASRSGRLMLSWRLVLAPPGSLETVVVHELVHLRVFGHGPGFWHLVASRRPSHLADRAWLRRNSHAVHSALDVWPDGGDAGVAARARLVATSYGRC